MKSLMRQFRTGKRNLKTSAWLAIIAAGLGCTTGLAQAQGLDQALTAYDTAITADTTAALARLTNSVTLDGTAGVPFNFGPTSGDTTLEFVLRGDPVATGDSGYLAVGESTGSSLRYEQYQNTHRLGFTQAGVADYTFTPEVPSPADITHLTFVWNSTEFTLRAYVNGVLAGTTTEVSDAFVMPSGEGLLGNNAAGAEGMVGTIYRVTVYSGLLPEAKIKSHADVLGLATINSFTATPDTIASQSSAVLNWQVSNATAVYLNNEKVTVTSKTVSPPVTTAYTLVASNAYSKATSTVKLLVNPRLDLYDAAIAADSTGGLTPLAMLTNTVNLTGAAGEPFDFGPGSGDSTMEFILEGDPEATGDAAFLAVGENTLSNLRYEQFQNTRQIGFTQGGVADYLFVPGVPSPSVATHLAFVWNASTFTMKLYVNGVLSGTVPNVSDSFGLPYGIGTLGANPTGGELMIGRIFRVTVYSGVLPEATIQGHATAFTSALRPPLIKSFAASPSEILGQGSANLTWEVQDSTGVFLDGVEVTGKTNQTVSPSYTTTYTLMASNNVSTVTTKATVFVTPKLDKYDAAIAADAASLTPAALLTNALTLTGSGLTPFDFGFTSGDVSMEFVLEGDPTVGADAYLAVGDNPFSNLRYAQWSNTRELGFTQGGVADYQFSPGVPSPTIPTHVTYVWNAAAFTMSLFTNGILAGTVTNVSDSFAMPSGQGYLGSTPTGGEAMVGRIFRLASYPGVLPEATIKKHADAFISATPRPSKLSVVLSNSQPVITLEGVAGAHYRVEYRESLLAADGWQLLQDIPALSGNSVQVTDPTPVTGKTARYYRAAQQP